MKDILARLSVFTVAKLERRAQLEGKTLEEYVSSFLDKGVEPNQPH